MGLYGVDIKLYGVDIKLYGVDVQENSDSKSVQGAEILILWSRKMGSKETGNFIRNLWLKSA